MTTIIILKIVPPRTYTDKSRTHCWRKGPTEWLEGNQPSQAMRYQRSLGVLLSLVERSFMIGQVWRSTILCMETSCFSAHMRAVENGSWTMRSLRDTCWCTLEKSLTSAPCAQRDLVWTSTSRLTCVFIPERNPLFVLIQTAANALIRSQICMPTNWPIISKEGV